MDVELISEDGSVTDACTLPTRERPLRRREFDELFAHDVVGLASESPGRVRLDLRGDPEVAARAAALAVRETDCCSFFSFELTVEHGSASLTISASAAHKDVLASLTARAESRIGTGQ